MSVGLRLVAVALAALVFAPPLAAQRLPVTVLEGATLIDGSGRPPLPASTVVIDGERIVTVGTMGAVTIPADAQRIDLRGKFIIPGLIDMHAHAIVPRCDLPATGRPLRFDRVVSEKMLSVLLQYGITTARSPATPTREGVTIRDDVASGRVPGPRLFVSAELINGAGQSVASVRAAVQRELRSPVDFIKLYSVLSPDAVRAGITAAHANNTKVIGHLGRTTWAQAAEMGIDFLTHATAWSVEDLPPSKRAGYRRALARRGAMRARIDWLEAFDPESPTVLRTIALLARRKISVDPTLVAFESKFLDPAKAKYRRNAARAAVPEMLEDWQRCGTPTDDWTQDDYARMARAWPTLLRLVKKYHEGGVLLTTGSDVTNPWVIPGESIHQELELLASAGIAPRDVITIATRNGAEALGILNETGTIEQGKLADLIVLDRDPLLNISDTRSIAMVMQRGRWVRR